MGRLEGKSIVITGGGNGLGAAYARAAVAEGAAVVVNDIEGDAADDVVAGLKRGGARAVAHNGDVSSWEFAGTLIDRCVDEFGRIDGLVNNAGILIIQPIEEQDGRFRRLIEVDLLGQAYCGLHAIPRMLAQGSGVVVNTLSGAQAGSAFRCAYSSATAAVAGLTSSWASECADTGVRVNAVAPIAATRQIDDTEPAMKRLYAQGRVSAGFTKIREQMKGMTTDMNAPMMIFLLSEASKGINGQTLRMNGNELQLISRPAAVWPAVTQQEWTVEKIEEAFATGWQDKQVPLGLGEYKMEFVRKLS